MADAPKGQTCETCRFFAFAKTESGATNPYCRRYPPTNFIVGQTSVMGQTTMPITHAFFVGMPGYKELWCGEWKPPIAVAVPDQPAEVVPMQRVDGLPDAPKQT